MAELRLSGLRVASEVPFVVSYKGQIVGQFFAYLLVEDLVIVELKCVGNLAGKHTAQCLNYLRAAGLRICLLVNFQKPKVEWKRIVCGWRKTLSLRSVVILNLVAEGLA